MELTYHLVTATSVDAERAFSIGGRVITKLRNRLSDKSARSSIVLASWLKNKDFMCKAEMRGALENRWRRGKNRAQNAEQTQESGSNEYINISDDEKD